MSYQLSLFDQAATQIEDRPPPSVITLQANAAFAIPKLKVSMDLVPDMADRHRIINADDCANVLRETWPGDGKMTLQEVFRVVMLNRNNMIIGIFDAFTGGVSATIVDPKIIMSAAVTCCASAMICAHNHPSGNLMPSSADRQITRKLQAGGMLMDIRLLDHLIFSPYGAFYSMADEGQLPGIPSSVEIAVQELGIKWD